MSFIPKKKKKKTGKINSRRLTLAWFQRWTKCLATSRQGGPQRAQWTSCHGIRGYFLRSNSSLIVSSQEFGSDSLHPPTKKGKKKKKKPRKEK